jgi:hypothetical protein
MYTSIPVCLLEYIISPYFRTKISWQNFYVVLGELIEYALYFIIKDIIFIITFMLSWCMRIQNNNVKPSTS